MKPIPISAAKVIADKYGYDQVVIIARKVGDDGGEHVASYGVDKANGDAAARVGNFLKARIMGWPDELKALADRFLVWPLPKSVRSDLCVTEDYAFPRSGTNLLSADEANQMIEYLLGPTGSGHG